MIVTTEESDVLNGLVTQMAALAERERQRGIDRVAENELRATLRKADEGRWDALDRRLDRVQASVEDVQRDFSEVLKERREDSAALRRQSDEIVGKVRTEAEAVAEKLRLETETVAAALKDVTVKTAVILKAREDGQVVQKFLGRTTRTILAVIAVVLFTALAFALFEHKDDISGDIATGIAAMAAVIAIVYATRRKS